MSLRKKNIKTYGGYINTLNTFNDKKTVAYKVEYINNPSRLNINEILTYQQNRYKLYFNIINSLLVRSKISNNTNDNNTNDNNTNYKNEIIISAILSSNNIDDVETIINNNPNVTPEQIRYILNSIIRDISSIYYLDYKDDIYVFIHGVLLADKTTSLILGNRYDTISRYMQHKEDICKLYLKKLDEQNPQYLKDIFGSPNIRSYNEYENIFESFASSYKIVNSNIIYSREIGLGYNHPNNTLFYLLELNIMNRYILRGCYSVDSIIGKNITRDDSIDSLDNLYNSNEKSYIDMITTQYSIYNTIDNTRDNTRDTISNNIINTGTQNTTSFRIPRKDEIKNLSYSILTLLGNILNAVYRLNDNKYINDKNNDALPYTKKIIIYSNILMTNTNENKSNNIQQSSEDWLSIDPLNTLLLRVINILITDSSYEFDINLNEGILKTIRRVIKNNNDGYDYNKYNMYFPSYLDVRLHQMPQFHKWYELYISYNIFDLILVNPILPTLGGSEKINLFNLQNVFRGRQRRLLHYYSLDYNLYTPSPSIDQIGYSYELLLCNKYINLIEESEY